MTDRCDKSEFYRRAPDRSQGAVNMTFEGAVAYLWGEVAPAVAATGASVGLSTGKNGIGAPA
jgi:hypothetical protein